MLTFVMRHQVLFFCGISSPTQPVDYENRCYVTGAACYTAIHPGPFSNATTVLVAVGYG